MVNLIYETEDDTPRFKQKGGIEPLPDLSFKTKVLVIQNVDADDTGSPNDWWFAARIHSGNEHSPGGMLTPAFWVQKKHLVEVADATLPFEVLEDRFVRWCVSSEIIINLSDQVRPFFVDADYLMAWAVIETGMKN